MDDDKEMYNNELMSASRHAAEAAAEIYFAQKVKNSATLDRIAQELKTIASELEDIAEA